MSTSVEGMLSNKPSMTTPPPHITIVEADTKALNFLCEQLGDLGDLYCLKSLQNLENAIDADLFIISIGLDRPENLALCQQLRESDENQVIAGLTQQENTSASSMALGVLPVADIKDYKVNADSVIDRVGDLLLQAKQSSDHFLVDQLEPNELTTH